jgi:hypothetical protein
MIQLWLMSASHLVAAVGEVAATAKRTPSPGSDCVGRIV